MSQIVNITITSAGPDMGPYSILLVDNLGNITTAATGVPKSSLFAPGYTITVNDNIVAIRLQSVNADCLYTEFFIPPPPPPSPACFYLSATNGADVTWTDYLGVEHTEPYDELYPAYCAQVGSLSTTDQNAVITGGTVSCADGICPDIPSCYCFTIKGTGVVNYVKCDGNGDSITLTPGVLATLCARSITIPQFPTFLVQNTGLCVTGSLCMPG